MQGVVEVFELHGHPQARFFAYAWSYKADDGAMRYVAILGVSPIESADDAVRDLRANSEYLRCFVHGQKVARPGGQQ